MANKGFSPNKVIITGSGKCGTTFLVTLLTRLGLSTGYTENDILREGDGGLEWPIRGEKARDPSPRVIKNPSLCRDLFDRCERWGWTIDHIYVPIRKFEHAAEHRFDRNKRYNPKFQEKLKTSTEEEMKKELIQMGAANIGHLMESLVDKDIPLTFIRFPRMVVDHDYLREKLIDTVGDIPPKIFLREFRRTANEDYVHFGREDLEQT